MPANRAEFVEEWNAALDYKIKESDLINPTESFVVRALLTLLDSLNIKDTFSILMSSEDKIQAQIAKATFVKFVDRVYKFSDPKATFIYGDMAFPQPGRTLRMLSHLLNYLFYYNSMKEEVLNRVKPLTEYNKLKSETNELHVKLEKLKLQKENYAKLLTEHEQEENTLRKKHDEMSSYSKKLEDEFLQLNTKLNEFLPFIRHLTQKTENLSKELVDQEAAKKLEVMKKEMIGLKLDLVEKVDVAHQTAANCKQIIENLKSNNERIETILKELQHIDKVVGDFEVDIQEIKKNIQDCVKATDDVATDEKLDLAELNKLLDDNTQNMKRIKGKIKKMNRVKIAKETEYERLVVENNKTIGILENSKQEMSIIIEIGARVCKTMNATKAKNQ